MTPVTSAIEPTSGPRRAWRLGCAFVLTMLAAALLLPPVPATAHTPHDDVLAVAVSPDFASDQRVYAIVRSYLVASDDGGITWRRLVRGLDHRTDLSALSVSGADSDVVYVGTRGDGVYRSNDAGNRWEPATGNLRFRNVRGLFASPHDADDVLVTVGVDGSMAMLRTTDGGATWTPLADGVEVQVAAFAPDRPGLLVTGSSDGVVRVSTDDGATFAEAPRLADSGGIVSIALSPNIAEDQTFVVATRGSGLYRTTDGGRSFERVGEDELGDLVVSVAYDPDPEVQTLWASTWRNGVLRSEDGGESWTDQREGLTTDEQAELLDQPDFGQLSVGASAEGEAPELFIAGFNGLFHATGTGPWEEAETQASRNVVGIGISPNFAQDQTVAVATYINGAKISTDGGETWEPINDGLGYGQLWVRSEDYFARLFAMHFSPTFEQDQRLFTGLRGTVAHSDSAGAEWSTQTPDGLLVAGEIPPDYVIWGFSPDYANDGTIFLGTDGGKVFRSTGGSLDFEKVGQLDSPIVTIRPSNRFATDDTVLAGTEDGMWRSPDLGATWQQIGLAGMFVTTTAVSSDPDTKVQVAVGTKKGLFVAGADPTTWRPVKGQGFDDRFIEAVAMSPSFGDDGTMLVSVRGRGLFKSTDGGTTFEPAAPELLDEGVVIGQFYHQASESIVFSPTFAEDQTVFGASGDALYRSTDAGDTWSRHEMPLATHDLDPSSSPKPLLEMPLLAEDQAQRDQDNRGFDTPIGRLSLRRVAAAGAMALVVFAGIMVIGPRLPRGRRPATSWVVRIGVPAVVGLAMLVVLAV